jgi:branched-chain amino acid transport system permease protein
MFVEQILNGIVLGSMYALVALGFTLVFGVLDKLNFAHSEIFMAGGFFGVAALAMGCPLWLAAVQAVVGCAALGLAVELVSFRKFKSADAQITAAISSLGFGIVITEVIHKLYGGEPVSINMLADVRNASFLLFGVKVHFVKIGILAITLVVLVALFFVLKRTSLGRNINAVAESPSFAALLGINVKAVNQQTFFISSALAGLGGFLLALRTGVASPDVGITFGLKALAIMTIGGMGNLGGAVVGGISLGVIESLAVQFGFGGYGEVIVWVLMSVVLLLFPKGLFVQSAAERRA